MQISVTGNNRRRAASRGFTLVEILVALVIVSLLSGLVVVTLPSSRGVSSASVAERLAARMKIAADTAILTGRMTGLELAAGDYRFITRSVTGWSPLDVLNARRERWPEDMLVVLSIEGERLTLSPTITTRVTPRPDLYFTPGGELPAFRLELHGPEGVAAISASPAGGLRLEGSRS